MPSGTKIRAFSRLLDSSDAPFWVIGADGKLIYLSAGVGKWLGIDVEVLAGRHSVAGSAISDEPFDFLAASLSPPPGFAEQGTASLQIQPPNIDDRKIPSLDVRFTRMGDQGQFATIAVGGKFDDSETPEGLVDAVAMRQRLDAWRKESITRSATIAAGVSSAARRLRAQLQIATKVRSHMGLFGPRGCGSLSIAKRIHHTACPEESMIVVDGPLMDSELLEASMMPLINSLTDNSATQGTVIVQDLSDTPAEAQQRLVELITTFGDRLRLMALCGQTPTVLQDPFDNLEDDVYAPDEPMAVGIHNQLIEKISCLSIRLEPLAARAEDVPIIATAILDTQHAAGDGPAERFSRAALDALVIYPWPGDLDELENAVCHAVRSAPHATIGVEQLPLAVRSYRPGGAQTAPSASSFSLDDVVRRYEAKIISQMMADTDGNRAEAARRMGISRARLLRKLDEYDGANPVHTKSGKTSK